MSKTALAAAEATPDTPMPTPAPMQKTAGPGFTATPEVVAHIKRNLPGIRIFKKCLNSVDYIFRAITRSEYAEIMAWGQRNQNVKVSDYDEKFIEKAILFPPMTVPELDEQPAGVVPALSQLIQERSLLLPPNNDPSALYEAEMLQEKPESERPTQEEIDSIKGTTQTGLHLVSVDGRHFIVRPMVRTEWNLLQQIPDSADGDVEACRKCVLWPTGSEWVTMPAGVPASVSRHILILSGFNDPGESEEL